MSGTLCVNCGEAASLKHALPVNNAGEISPITSKEPWAGMPACVVCNRLHALGGDNGPEILFNYAQAVPELRNALHRLRITLKNIRKLADAE